MSSEQKVKVVRKAQTENPLYLKTLLEVNNCVVNYAQSTILRVLKSNCSETTKDVWCPQILFSFVLEANFERFRSRMRRKYNFVCNL